MNSHSEYNKFTILGPPMRSYAFIILFSVLSAIIFAQNTDVTSNSLTGHRFTQTNVMQLNMIVEFMPVKMMCFMAILLLLITKREVKYI